MPLESRLYQQRSILFLADRQPGVLEKLVGGVAQGSTCSDTCTRIVPSKGLH